jgi:hypothetical protein
LHGGVHHSDQEVHEDNDVEALVHPPQEHGEITGHACRLGLENVKQISQLSAPRFHRNKKESTPRPNSDGFHALRLNYHVCL